MVYPITCSLCPFAFLSTPWLPARPLLQARQSEAAARKLSSEKKALEQAFGEMRSLVKEASCERQDLSRQLDAARAQGAEHAGAAQELRGALDLANAKGGCGRASEAYDNSLWAPWVD